MTAMDEFDRLYFISDLHLGGRRGAEVFNSHNELQAFLRWVGTHGDRVALVLGGDLIDFLSFQDAKHFNAANAKDRVAEVATERATRVIFDELKTLAAQTNITLVLMGGNHDIELALPEVREELLQHVAARKHRHRVRTVLDGTGYTCRVGDREVLCLHGNERDKWNVVDHGALLRVIRAMNAGSKVPPWEPNPGTTLVINVMNQIKRNLPFIDLLQPETEAAVRVLLALTKEERGASVDDSVRELVRILLATQQTQARINNNTLGDVRDEAARAEEQLAAMERPRSPSPWLVDATDAESRVNQLFEHTEARFRDNAEPLDPQLLGTLGMLGPLDWITRSVVRPKLRDALKQVFLESATPKSDRSPHTSIPSPEFEALDRWIGPDKDVVIAGHTHVEKHHPRKHGKPGSVYMNAGTWIRVIRLENDWLEEPVFQEQFMPALLSRSMAQLDAAKVANRKLVRHHRTVACVEPQETGRAVSRLRKVKDDASVDALDNIFEVEISDSPA